MAVPKRKVSKARRDKRRSNNWKLEAPTLFKCPKCGEYNLAHRVCKNLEAVVTAAGSSLQNAVKTVCFLANMSDFAAFNEVYAQYFTEKPARSCVAVKDLPKGALVEVEVVAEKE